MDNMMILAKGAAGHSCGHAHVHVSRPASRPATPKTYTVKNTGHAQTVHTTKNTGHTQTTHTTYSGDFPAMGFSGGAPGYYGATPYTGYGNIPLYAMMAGHNNTSALVGAPQPAPAQSHATWPGIIAVIAFVIIVIAGVMIVWTAKNGW